VNESVQISNANVNVRHVRDRVLRIRFRVCDFWYLNPFPWGCPSLNGIFSGPWRRMWGIETEGKNVPGIRTQLGTRYFSGMIQ